MPVNDLDETGDMLCISFLQRECSQLQPSNPALGTSPQRCDIFCREIESHHLIEKCSSFIIGETQIGDTQFGQLTPPPQKCQRRWRIDARW